MWYQPLTRETREVDKRVSSNPSIIHILEQFLRSLLLLQSATWRPFGITSDPVHKSWISILGMTGEPGWLAVSLRAFLRCPKRSFGDPTRTECWRPKGGPRYSLMPSGNSAKWPCPAARAVGPKVHSLTLFSIYLLLAFLPSAASRVFLFNPSVLQEVTKMP